MDPQRREAAGDKAGGPPASDGQLLVRYADRREEAERAFEALVQRHGAMVLAVCRQVLRDPHDVEDAFQATFLVLVRRAGSIRNKEALGSWLYGVARRIAVRAKVVGDRRRRRERNGVEPEGTTVEEAKGDELRRTLLDEIDRLPERYRAPVILCELEGHTHAEAARRLDWPIGTVSGRLSRARDLLRSRIARRGLAVPMLLMAWHAGVRPVSAGLVGATTRAAFGLAASKGTLAGGLALATARGIIRKALIAKAGLSVGLAAGAVAAGLALGGARPAATTPPRPVASRPVEAPAPGAIAAGVPRRDDPITTFAVAPDGRTVATGGRDATVRLWDRATGRERRTLRGHSAAILALSFAPDGKTLASAAADCSVRFWDVDSGRLTLRLGGPAG